MNKPFGWYVAGMIFEGKDGEQEAKDFENGLSKDGYEEKAIPLYTHPVELTDEEIADIAGKTDIFDPKWIYVFARAIMKRCGIISGTNK